MRLPQLSPALWTLFLACLVPELVLSLADLAGASLWRALATGYLGFWPGLLGDWRPNYPGQAGAMFVTYGFLHAGPVHFAVNMMSLVSLGAAVEESVGPRGFWRIYGAALVGGGLGYGVLVSGTVPMVGASGALFGLAGALVFWGARDGLVLGRPMGPVWRAVGLLLGLNLVLYWVTGGRLAWQTHLGGFVAGGLMGLWEIRGEIRGEDPDAKSPDSKGPDSKGPEDPPGPI